MDSRKGFAPIIIVIIVAITAVSSGVLYYRVKKPAPVTQPQEFSQQNTTIKIRRDPTPEVTHVREKTPHAQPSKESKGPLITPKPSLSPSPSRSPGAPHNTQRAGDPWKDPIPQAPVNLALPLVVADIRAANAPLSPYGIIRHSRDGGIGHGGIDFPLAHKSPVYAVTDGTILKNNLEDDGGGNTIDVLITPGEVQGEGWIFKYDHINLMPGLTIGSKVEKGQQIGINGFEETGNNHIGLEYHIRNFTIAREKICWVDRLEPVARKQLESAFNGMAKNSAFVQFWQTANEEGYFQYKGLLDTTRYPNGPQLCYSLGLDPRIPLSSGAVQQTSKGTKEIYGDRIPFHTREGVSFEYYWPADPIAPGLSEEETEILVHNESGREVEISFVEVDFSLNGKNYTSPPGSWEKFTSRLNWNRIEYRIFERGTVTPPFVLTQNQKGKLHYHFTFSERPTSDKSQSVHVKINFSVANTPYTLDMVVRRLQ